MASTSTIKQRFIDILFESEEDENTEKSLKEKKEKPIVIEDTSLKASDIIYQKKQEKESNHKSTFINLDDEIKKKKEDRNEDFAKEELFSPTPNLSPIFGNIDNPKKKVKTEKRVIPDFTAVQKPSSNYLGMVLSPIYGFDSKSANEARLTLLEERNKVSKKEDVIEEIDIFETYEFDKKFVDDINKEEDASFKTSEINLFDNYYKEED